jgi:hypothetical protein
MNTRHSFGRSFTRNAGEPGLGDSRWYSIARLLTAAAGHGGTGHRGHPGPLPQAKGRIERLWGTLQDRPAKELRLAGRTTLEQANAFLPGFIERYNARFAKDPQDPQSTCVPLPADLDLHYYFAIRDTRKVRADHCIGFNDHGCLFGQAVPIK